MPCRQNKVALVRANSQFVELCSCIVLVLSYNISNDLEISEYWNHL